MKSRILLWLSIGAIYGSTGMHSTASATIIHLTYNFAEPAIEAVSQAARSHYRVSIPGVVSYGRPGRPVLPIKAATVLLPPGEEIADIEVISHNETLMPGTYRIEHGRLQVPISKNVPQPSLPPDSAIYASVIPYPGKLFARGSTHRLCGHVIAHVYLYPVHYVPGTGKLSYYREMELRITTRTAVGQELPLCATVEVRERVAKLVDNPDALAGYSLSQNSELVIQGLCNYVIITDEMLKPAFEELLQFKTNRGVKTEIVTVESIYAGYTGTDEQEKLRNCITDLYINHGLKYVLLGGDDEIVPHRGLYDVVNEEYPGYECEEPDMPGDMYYGCLDGNWDADGDKRWGEAGEADLYAEVFVGRACCDSDSEVANFVAKTINYQTSPPAAYCLNALMLGEDLHWEAWGGEYKEEVRNGSTNWGYTTEGFPPQFNTDTLYDSPSYHWNKEDLIPLLNGGVHLVNHLGHANQVYVMKMHHGEVASRLQNPFDFIIHSQGCYSASFDNRDPYGSYNPDDCIGEQFTTMSDGAVAFIGNSRYGWGDYSSTDGTSQRLDREFFDAMFGEHIYKTGKALQDAKEDAAPYIDSMDALRWCCYNLCLLGDPELDMWTAIPESLTLVHEDTVFLGPSLFTVTATKGGSPVESALVCLRMDSTVYARGYTNAAGHGEIAISPANVGPMQISVTAHDCLPFQGCVTVVSSGTPYVAYYKSGIDDDSVGASSGNGDWQVNPGESIEMPLWVRNFGLVQAVKTHGILRTTDPYVSIQADSGYFGSIQATDSAAGSDSYVFTVTVGCPDDHTIQFDLHCYDSAGACWISSPQIKVCAPVLKYEEYSVDDSGQMNPNGRFDPGERVELIVEMKNDGSTAATNVQAVLRTEDTYITVLDSIANYPDLPPGSQEVNTTSYVIEATSTTPEHHLVGFSIYLTAAGYEDTVEFVLRMSPGGDFLVWDPDHNHSSGPAINEALLLKGYIGDYTLELGDYLPYLTSYKAIFVSLGIWFCNHVLADGPDVDSLCSYLDQGGNLYLEGGNCWFGDSATKLQPYFHITGKSIGRSDLDTIVGRPGTIAESMKFKYKGENKRMDRIEPGEGAWSLFSNVPTIYDNAVTLASNAYKTIGTDFELGKLVDKAEPCRRATLIDSIMRWFLRDAEHDVAVWSIDNIPPNIRPGVGICPQVTVKNLGGSSESFSLTCIVDSAGREVYRDTQIMNSLTPDSAALVTFRAWTPGEVVEYEVRVSHDLSDDEPGNNSRTEQTLSFVCIAQIVSPHAVIAPAIDGLLDTASEWASAASMDISNVFDKGKSGQHPLGSAYLYLLNDSLNLYVGIDVRCDSTRDDLDGFCCMFDDNYNHAYPSWPDSSEGALTLLHVSGADSLTYTPFMSDSGADPYAVAMNARSGVAAGHIQYEVAIPLGSKPEHLNVSTRDSIGLHLIVGRFDDQAKSAEYCGWWPQTAGRTGDPAQMGTIVLATSPGSEAIRKSPEIFSLSYPAPNPACKKTLIRYALARNCRVELKIYNAGGRLVRRLVDKREEAGYKTVFWDCANDRKEEVASGIYFCRLVATESVTESVAPGVRTQSIGSDASETVHTRTKKVVLVSVPVCFTCFPCLASWCRGV
jgi:hypothetical protein